MTMIRSNNMRVALTLFGTLGATSCFACTGYSGASAYGSNLNVPVEKRDAPQGTSLMGGTWGILGNGAVPTNYFFSGCSPDERVAIAVQVNGPLTYVADVVYAGRVYAGYELTPSSPLYIFQHVTEIGTGTGAQRFEAPMRDLSGIFSAGATPPPGNTDTTRSSYIRYSIVARGGLMTTTSGIRVSFSMSPQAYPSLRQTVSLGGSVIVEQPTCHLVNQTVQLDDIASVDMAMQGPSTYIKHFTLSMACNLAGESIRMSIRDAGAGDNNGMELSPTADSTAQGVRLQLLRDGRPLAMNTSWTAPSVKGNITLDMGARYYRIAGPFLSGTIGGKATLTVDYL